MDTHDIFELVKLSGSPRYPNDKYLTVLISEGENSAGLSIGTPGIVLKHEFEETSGSKKIGMLFPFPSIRAGLCPNYCSTIKRRHIIECEGNMLNNHIIRDLQQLHINGGLPVGAMQGNWEAIKKHVNTKGPITFRIKSHNNNLTGLAALRFLKDLNTIVDGYNYNSVTYHDSLSSYKNPKNMIYLVTFLGIKDCIPVFNHKRVDGMCVIITFVSKAKMTHTLNPIVNVALLLSNYPDNAFVVDGTWISIPEALHPDTFGRLAKLINMNIIVKPKTKQPKKKVKAAGVVWNSTMSLSSSSSTSAEYRYSTA